MNYGGTPTVRSIEAHAPTRVCDCGGWTDTWFARHGAVFHIGVEPGVSVRIECRPRLAAEPTVAIEAVNFGDRYAYTPGARPWGRHPLIEAAIESVGIPAGVDIDVSVASDMPPGASTGTSGAVCVAVVGAMRHLAGQPTDPAALAAAAHGVETDLLGQQSGVQDQQAAAFGGINYIEIPAYPDVVVSPLEVPVAWRLELESRMVLVYLGRSHSSTAVHEAVIRDVIGIGPDHAALGALRLAARAARDAVLSCDVAALGAAMQANTEAQRLLHPALVSGDASRLITLARSHGACGWKVNGAGGEGGSVVLLTPDAETGRRVAAAVAASGQPARVIPVRIATAGLTVHASSSRQGSGS